MTNPTAHQLAREFATRSRRIEVALLLLSTDGDISDVGWIARELGERPATIRRDIAAILEGALDLRDVTDTTRGRASRDRTQFSAKTTAREPLRGSLHARYVTCGKPNCRCQRGAKHGPYFRRHFMDGGRKRDVYVRRAEVERVRTALVAWRARHPSMRAMTRDLQLLDQWHTELGR